MGNSLADNLYWDCLGSGRFLVVGIHLHLALAGWVFLVVIGVAHRLLPMFLVSHGAPEWRGRVAALFTGVVALALVFVYNGIQKSWAWILALLHWVGRGTH